MYFELLEAFNVGGCPVCSLLLKSVRSYLTNLLYENVNDEGVRQLLRQSLGFCRDHSNALLGAGDTFGIAIIYQDILQHLHAGLSKENPESLRPQQECPACAYRDKFERLYLDTLGNSLNDEEMMRALNGPDGLCLSHLRQLADRIRDVDVKHAFFSQQEKRLERGRKHLVEFIRKQDIQFKNESISPEEETSCGRAIDFFAGKSG